MNFDGVVGHNQDDCGEGGYVVLVADRCSPSNTADCWIFHSIIVYPVDTSRITVASGNFHKKHIVHVAAQGRIGLDKLRTSLLARTTGSEEEVDKHRLTAIKDVEQMYFGAVNVSSCEVNSLSEIGLRF